jgi:hypothetical protein
MLAISVPGFSQKIYKMMTSMLSFYIRKIAIKVGMIVEKFYFVKPYYQLSLLAYKE